METTRAELEAKLCFIKENQFKEFESEADMFAFLSSRKENDELVSCKGYQITVKQLDNMPLLIFSGDVKKTLPDLNPLVDDDELCRIMNENMFLISFPYDRNRTALPIAQTVECAMYDRSKTNCAYITQENPDARRNVISLEERSKLVTDAFSKTKKDVHILVRNGLVWAINDGVHTHTPEYDLLRRVFAAITKFEDYELVRSFFYNDASFVRIMIHDSAAEKELATVFTETGIECKECKLGVQFFDGVRANSSSRLQAVAYIDKKVIPVGEDIRMEHRNDRGTNSASLELWSKKCDQLYSLIKDSTEAMRKLAKIRIKNVGGTLRMAALKEKFPIEATINVSNWFESQHPHGCTALDVYCALFDIVEEYEDSLEKEMSPITKLGWDEKCARFLKKDVVDVALSEEAFRAISKG